MNEMNILFSLDNQRQEYKEIEISVENELENNLDYKFLVGLEGTWTTLKKSSDESVAIWKPQVDGKYSIMVQAKRKESKKPFDFMSKTDYIVGESCIKPINDIYTDKMEIIYFKCLTENILEGTEIVFEVEAKYEDNMMLLYKFVKIDFLGNSICIQDYSTKKLVSYVETNSGDYKLLCMAKDMFSLKQFDDRALIYYSVDPYEKIKIHSFTSDLSSPQLLDTPIILKCIVSGGTELLYKFDINGKCIEDSEYIKENAYTWTPKESGEYKVDLWVKDVSFKGEYEQKKSLSFIIEDICTENVSIEDIIIDKKDIVLVGDRIHLTVKAKGGNSLRYSYIVFKDGKETEKIEFGINDFVDFIPEECGNFKLETRVKDKYSKSKFDVCKSIYIEALEYIKAEIEYIIMDKNKYYMVGDTIHVQVITGNTRDILINYILKIDDKVVEQTSYTKQKNYELKPKSGGNYVIEILAKNKLSTSEYDCREELKIEVHTIMPVTDTKILCDMDKFIVNETITFESTSKGGKDVVYEFYLMEKENWSLVQEFSKKDDYTFMPFSKGKYRMLVLSKSFYKSISYEDYDIMEIEVKE